jgi:hypothetical protein
LFRDPNIRNLILSSLAVAFLSSVAFSQQTLVRRVDIENGSTNGDGTGWGQSAYRFLQDALEWANGHLEENEEDTVEIWVAQGVYRPDQSKANDTCVGDPLPPGCCGEYGDCQRSARFKLWGNISIYGGFQGVSSEVTKDDRSDDVTAFRTILSGDIEGDDEIILFQDDALVLDFGNREDNSRNVLFVPSGAMAVVDRVTIRGAHGGSGVRVDGSLIIQNSIIEQNTAANHGGGLFITGSLQMRRCIIRHNRTLAGDEAHRTTLSSGSVGVGGGVYQQGEMSEVIMIAGAIEENLAHRAGGGFAMGGMCSATFVNLRISDNRASTGCACMAIPIRMGSGCEWTVEGKASFRVDRDGAAESLDPALLAQPSLQ